jgi:hypothetical protein
MDINMENIMNRELEKNLENEIKSSNLSDYASYLGLDGDEFEDFYYDVDFDDYSK